MSARPLGQQHDGLARSGRNHNRRKGRPVVTSCATGLVSEVSDFGVVYSGATVRVNVPV